MKRIGDTNDNIYLRVNQDQADVLRRFTQHTSGNDYGTISDSQGDQEKQEEEGGWHGTMSMGFKHGSSHAEISGIRRMPMPREDGYIDNPYEAAVADDRPYGRKYFDDQLTRQRIMEEDDNYHWVEILSGLMNKSPIDLYQESDIDRLLMERETERLRMRAEISRTIVSDKEKKRERETLVQYKRDVQKDLETFSNTAAYSRLVLMGQYLIDGSLVTGQTYSERYGITPLRLLQYDLQLIMQPLVPMGQDEVAREKEIVSKHNETTDSESRAVSQLTADQQRHYAFIQLTLFRNLLDMKSGPLGTFIVNANTNMYDQLMNEIGIDVIETLVRAGQEEEALKMLPNVTISRKDEISEDNADLIQVDRDGIKWSVLAGTESVALPRILELYDQPTIAKMVEYGLRARYGDVKIKQMNGEEDIYYADLMWDFLINKPGFDQRLREAGFNLRSDHPPEVNAVLNVALEKVTDVDMKRINRLMQSHYIWWYFDERSVRGLAEDWDANGESVRVNGTAVRKAKSLTDTNGYAKSVEEYIKILLLIYFSIVIQICNLKKVPVVLANTTVYTGLVQPVVPNPPLFQLPADIADYSYKSDAGMDDSVNKSNNVALFDELNERFRGIDVSRFIANPTFEQYYRTGVSSFVVSTSQGPNIGGRGPQIDDSRSRIMRAGSGDSLVTLNEPQKLVQKQQNTFIGQLYPILSLHYLFKVYDQFMNYYREFLAQRLNDLDRGIQEVDDILLQIAREDLNRRGDRGTSNGKPNPLYNQRLSFTGQPINNGIIRLKSTVMSFMEKAYDFVQDYCDELRGLPIEEFQTKAADLCGLEVAFASFVAALIAENEIMYGKSYKSLSSQRNIMAHCGNELTRLRKFGYRKKLDGTYEVFNLYGARQPGGDRSVQQRQTINKRVLRVAAF